MRIFNVFYSSDGDSAQVVDWKTIIFLTVSLTMTPLGRGGAKVR